MYVCQVNSANRENGMITHTHTYTHTLALLGYCFYFLIFLLVISLTKGRLKEKVKMDRVIKKKKIISKIKEK